MWQEDSDSDEAVEVETGFQFKPQFVLIGIDTHALMFKQNADGSLPFKNCLEACYTLAESLIVPQSGCRYRQFAVLLCREESPTLIGFQKELTDTVKLLKEKINLTDKQLVEEYQRKEEANLAEFFLTCKKAFHDIKTPFHKRTIIYITNDDEPVKDASKKFTALNEVKSFTGNQIDFQVVSMRQNFAYTKFYNELSSLIREDTVEEICEDAEGVLEKLRRAVIIRNTQKNVKFYPFKNNTARYLNCVRLDIIHTNKLNNMKVKIDGKTIKKVTDQAAPSYYIKRQLEPNIMFDEDVRRSSLNTTLPVGLHLLYISKRSTEVGYVFGEPFLLIWNEEETLPFLKKIWQYCTDNEKVLVCVRKFRQPDRLRYLELVPLNANSSPMFLAKLIPFGHEINYPRQALYPDEDINPGQMAAVSKLVDTLTFDFNIQMTPDPCYRKKRAYLKAKLLDQAMEEVDDITINSSTLDEYLKEVITSMNTNFDLADATKPKRKGASASTRDTKQRKLN